MKQVGRKLDKIERWFVDEDLYIISVATLEKQSNYELTQDVVEKASQIVTKQHQILQARYHEEERTGEAKWVIEPSIRSKALVETVQLQSINDWEQFYEDRLNKDEVRPDLKKGNSSWKIIIVNFGDRPTIQKLMINASHAIIDGRTSMMLVNEVMKWTLKLMFGSTTVEQELAQVETIPMAPASAEALLPQSKLTEQDKKKLQELLTSEEETPKLIPLDYPADGCQPSTEGIITGFNTTAGLIAFGKKYALTVGSMMGAALVQASSVFVFEREDYSNVNTIDMPVVISLDARTRSADKNLSEQAAVLVSEIYPVVTISRDMPFLEVCKSIQQELHNKINVEKEGHYCSAAFEMNENEEASASNEESNEYHLGDLEMGNLGKYSYPSQLGPFVIKNITAVTTSCSYAYTFSVASVTVEGVCTHSFMYNRAWMKKETIQRLVCLFEKLLESPSERITCKDLTSLPVNNANQLKIISKL